MQEHATAWVCNPAARLCVAMTMLPMYRLPQEVSALTQKLINDCTDVTPEARPDAVQLVHRVRPNMDSAEHLKLSRNCCEHTYTCMGTATAPAAKGSAAACSNSTPVLQVQAIHAEALAAQSKEGLLLSDTTGRTVGIDELPDDMLQRVFKILVSSRCRSHEPVISLTCLQPDRSLQPYGCMHVQLAGPLYMLRELRCASACHALEYLSACPTHSYNAGPPRACAGSFRVQTLGQRGTQRARLDSAHPGGF